MTVVEWIHDGLNGDETLLTSESILDGFASLAVAASMG
jgi:uncharacterized membrane protein YqgA involved in biofilm formation